jgi:flagella basal body P-ring formation protein FlgA
MALAALAMLTATLAAPAEIEAVLLEKLRMRYPDVTRWEVKPFDRANTADTSSDGDKVEIVTLGSRAAVRVGRRVQWYAVSGFREVVTAVRRAAAGESLDPTAGQLEERDVLGTKCVPLTDADALTGMRAKRSIAVNEIICASAVEPRPLVTRGAPVVVKYVGAHITLVTKGVAQADGAMGDTLRVRGAGNSKEFAAQVSGAGEVTIHE